MRFALNHITVPKMGLEEFFALAKSLNMSEVEIRNDLPNVVDSWKAKDVKNLAAKMGLTLLTINALYPFNQWSGRTRSQSHKTCRFCRRIWRKSLGHVSP